MRHAIVALLLAMGSATPALSQVSIHLDRPRLSIGINVPVYPTLQRVPGYPVYYAPSLATYYFFYDGLYWVYEGGEWYAGDWYNGPWYSVDPFHVPVHLLRVPVRYYRDPPREFRRWRADAPPRWHEYWGASWAERRAGWDRWERRSAPAPAPLPVYQRQYSGARYPRPEEQAVIQVERYRYQPREEVTRRVFEERRSVAEARRRDSPPGHQRGERPGPPDHAVARGHDRDERGIPEHAKGKAKGHERGEGKGRGRDKD